MKLSDSILLDLVQPAMKTGRRHKRGWSLARAPSRILVAVRGLRVQDSCTVQRAGRRLLWLVMARAEDGKMPIAVVRSCFLGQALRSVVLFAGGVWACGDVGSGEARSECCSGSQWRFAAPPSGSRSLKRTAGISCALKPYILNPKCLSPETLSRTLFAPSSRS